MTIQLGTGNITNLRLGSTTINKAYLGSTLVYDQSLPFLAEGVDFDGATFFNGPGLFNDVAHSFAFSCWVAAPINGAFQSLFSSGDTNNINYIDIKVLGNNTAIAIKVIDGDGSTVLVDHQLIGGINADTWFHILYSYNSVSGSLSSDLYINGVLQGGATILDSPSPNGGFFTPSIGRASTGIQPFTGTVSELWFDDQYIDFSIQANREKFVLNDIPVDLGSSGQLPTGSSPNVYMTGEAVDWNTGVNAGTRGDFTVIGAVSDTTNEPVIIGGNEGAYVAEGVAFDGTDYLGKLTPLTGLVDSKQGTFSWWTHSDTVQADFTRLVTADGNGKFSVILGSNSPANGGFDFILRNGSNGTILRFVPTVNGLDDGNWHHILFSFDMAAQTYKLYVDDIDVSGTPSQAPLNQNVGWGTTPYFGINGRATDGQLPFNGDVAEHWFTDEYLDLTVEANRRKFISVDGKPADLGTSGALPTGTSAKYYFSGDAAVWNAGTNAGTGGDFTMSGAVTDSVNEPVELPYVAEGVAFDLASAAYLRRTTSLTATNQNTLTVSCWLYRYSLSTAQPYICNGYTAASDRCVVRLNDGTSNRGISFFIAAGNVTLLNVHSVGDALDSLDTWHHVVVSFDLSNQATLKLFIDDVEQSQELISFENGNIGYNDFSTWSVSANETGSLRSLDSDISELYFTNEYIDLSVEANRRKFIDAAGKPVDLGTDGSTPTGTAPLIYMTGDASVWNAGTNKGTGGDFTMTGSVTDSTNEPVELP